MAPREGRVFLFVTKNEVELIATLFFHSSMKEMLLTKISIFFLIQ